MLLKQRKFGLSFTWSYDPMGVIFRLRVENKFTAYHHTSRHEITQYKNQSQWKENTFQKVEQQKVSTSKVQTPLVQEKTAKRGREEQSSPTIEASSQGFRVVCRKKRHRVCSKISATIQLQKTTFDGLGETSLFTQSVDRLFNILLIPPHIMNNR